MVNQRFLSIMNKESEEKGKFYPILSGLLDITKSVWYHLKSVLGPQIILFEGQIILFRGQIILFGRQIMLFGGQIILLGGQIILLGGQIILLGRQIIFSKPSLKVIKSSKLMILQVKIKN
jgi:hypothetical protein